MMRSILLAGLLLGTIASASAQTTLRVGDQKGNSQAVMEAALNFDDFTAKEPAYRPGSKNARI